MPPLPAIHPPVAQVPLPTRFPNTLSLSVVSWTCSALWFVTTTVNCTAPPSSLTCVVSGVFVTEMSGWTSSKVTVADAVAVSLLPSLSNATAVTVSKCGSAGSPVTVSLNAQE